MTAPFDLSRYQDPLTIQRILHNAKTVAIVGTVEESAARQLFRRLLPAPARLPRDSGQPARVRDPRREELREPGRRSRPRRHRQRVPRPDRRCQASPRKPSRSAPASCGVSSRSSTRKARGSPKPADCRSSWIAASKSSTRVMSAACTGSASTPRASRRSAADSNSVKSACNRHCFVVRSATSSVTAQLRWRMAR